jgi:hypothetical protein
MVHMARTSPTSQIAKKRLEGETEIELIFSEFSLPGMKNYVRSSML